MSLEFFREGLNKAAEPGDLPQCNCLIVFGERTMVNCLPVCNFQCRNHFLFFCNSAVHETVNFK